MYVDYRNFNRPVCLHHYGVMQPSQETESGEITVGGDLCGGGEKSEEDSGSG